MKFSLVLATLDRRDLVNEFLEALKKQKYKDFEVIIVDQSDNRDLEKDCEKYRKYFTINYLKETKGLSRARNKGLQYVNGDIVSFPDDDCIYPEELLYKVNKFFEQNDTFNILSIKMKNSFAQGRKINEGIESQVINKKNIFKLVASISLFVKREVVDELNGFNESLGLGSGTEFNGCEDYDYPLRAMEKGFKVFYNKDIEVLHPWDNVEILKGKNELEKAFKGGASEMYILNTYKYGFFYKISRCFRRFIIILYRLLQRDGYSAKVSFNILKGMFKYF